MPTPASMKTSRSTIQINLVPCRPERHTDAEFHWSAWLRCTPWSRRAHAGDHHASSAKHVHNIANVRSLPNGLIDLPRLCHDAGNRDPRVGLPHYLPHARSQAGRVARRAQFVHHGAQRAFGVRIRQVDDFGRVPFNECRRAVRATPMISTSNASGPPRATCRRSGSHRRSTS